MKRLVLVSAAVFFGITLLAVSVGVETRRHRASAVSHGGEETVLGEVREATHSAGSGQAEAEMGDGAEGIEQADNKEVNYYLAYPGILPDHPLYWLKMVRDRVLLWLARDPGVRIERLLLYADKRVGAARALMEGNQPELSVATVTKAEKYLEQAVGEAAALDAGAEGRYELFERLRMAALKHQEVLARMLVAVPEQWQSGIAGAMETNKTSQQLMTELTGVVEGEEGAVVDEEKMDEEDQEATDSGEMMEDKEVPAELKGTL